VRWRHGVNARAAHEECRQQQPHSARRTPPVTVAVVVEPGLGEEIDDRPARPGLGIARAEHDTRDSRVQDRAGAHRARLDRHVELAAGSR
jgi:hypothetical protein